MRIHTEVRPHIIALLAVMAYANSKEDVSMCGIDGVYGNAQRACEDRFERD